MNFVNRIHQFKNHKQINVYEKFLNSGIIINTKILFYHLEGMCTATVFPQQGFQSVHLLSHFQKSPQVLNDIRLNSFEIIHLKNDSFSWKGSFQMIKR